MSNEGGKGPWAVVGSISIALITSITSVIIAAIAAGDVQDHSKTAQEVVQTTAVDRVWVNERLAQYERALAVEKALRGAAEKVCNDRIGRLEDHVLRRRVARDGSPVAHLELDMEPEAEPEPDDDIVARELEKLQSDRPTKPNVSDPRVQQIIQGYGKSRDR